MPSARRTASIVPSGLTSMRGSAPLGQPVDRRAGGRVPPERLLVAVLDGDDLGAVAHEAGPDAVTGSERDPGRSHRWSCPPDVVERSRRRRDDPTVGQEADGPAFARERDGRSDDLSGVEIEDPHHAGGVSRGKTVAVSADDGVGVGTVEARQRVACARVPERASHSSSLVAVSGRRVWSCRGRTRPGQPDSSSRTVCEAMSHTSVPPVDDGADGEEATVAAHRRERCDRDVERVAEVERCAERLGMVGVTSVPQDGVAVVADGEQVSCVRWDRTRRRPCVPPVSDRCADRAARWRRRTTVTLPVLLPAATRVPSPLK